MIYEQRLSGETRNDARLDCGDHAEQSRCHQGTELRGVGALEGPAARGGRRTAYLLQFNDARLEVIGGSDPDRLTRPHGSVQYAISA